MKTVPQSFVLGQLWPLMQRHWFKLGIVFLFLYAFFSKEVSFNVQINNPKAPPTEWQSQEASRKEAFTENRQAIQEPEPSRFDFWPSWGGSEKSVPPIEALAQIDTRHIEQFIQRFKHVVEAEEEKFGIPASISLAHGLLMSKAGQSSTAQQAFNFFQLGCSDGWEGQTIDGPNGSCLRRYDNAWMSFRDHSLFYTTGKHHRLQDIPSTKVVNWAKALDASPANTIDNLEEQLLAVIERFHL